MTSKEIRKAFLDFFEGKGHKIVPSAPIVVKNDPTLMFVNSGMAPFKDIFLGNKPVQYPRVADTQKCLRVSGKHNDLEEVGVDTYHHTMFEMLGNWSFGDYFKKEAIQWSWELLTEVYKLPKDRLYVTVFEGDDKENLAFDQESYDCWKKYVDESRILRGNKKDNFWEMGDTGPCGPCSEIHVDLRDEAEVAKLGGAELVNVGHPQVIEIWNNVFMEFERKADKSLVPLPNKHVDTGMGFERLCVAIQGKKSNYDTDVFQPLIQQIAKMSGKPYTFTMPESLEIIKDNERPDIAMRVIADHLRTIAFAITDGQLPSNTGAGYVIRRILRRAVRYGYSYLGFEQPFICELVPMLAEQFADVFPELNAQKDFVVNVIREEESAFLRTLANGIKRFATIEKEIGADKQIPGKVAFELFDTYGFPLDLTKLMASEKGFSIDENSFDAEMKQQKDRARSAAATEQGDWVVLNDDSKTDFIGYDYTEADAQVLKYRKVKAKDKEMVQVVLDKTPFYAESGGQVGDIGLLDFEGEKIDVLDTKKENDLVIHFVKKLPANVNAKVHAAVNSKRREDTKKNHSATHLLQSALRIVLGSHVEQKGSLVNNEYLRFDFSHFSKMTDEEIAKVEQIVNEKIMDNIPLDERRNVPIEEAKKLGATALFGEKYGEYVRVITFDEKFSRELCGGIHVKSTGEIGLFKIISESSIASGVRRIEAVTGKKALEYINAKLHELETIATIFKNPKSIVQSVQNSLAEADKVRDDFDKLQDKYAAGVSKILKAEIKNVNGINLLTLASVDISSVDALRKLGVMLANETPNHLFILGANFNGKQVVHVRVSAELVKEKGLEANKLVKELGAGIKGGGPAEFVQASAENSEAVVSFIEKVKERIK
jgi:alanyl-tRNA synthetase